MSKKTNPRVELWSRLKYQHGITLSQPQLTAIEQFFHQSIKTSIFHVGMYRAINVVFTVLMLIGWALLRDTPLMKYFIPGSLVVFMIYNAFHLILNFVQYKNIKEPDTDE